MLPNVTDQERIHQLETALRGVADYVKHSNPKSLSRKDREAKLLAMVIIEAALNPQPASEPPPMPNGIGLTAPRTVGTLPEIPRVPIPPNPRMGQVVP